MEHMLICKKKTTPKRDFFFYIKPNLNNLYKIFIEGMKKNVNYS